MCKIPCITASSIKMVVRSPDFKNTILLRNSQFWKLQHQQQLTLVICVSYDLLREVCVFAIIFQGIIFAMWEHFCAAARRGGGGATDQKIYTPNFCPTDDEITLPQGLGQHSTMADSWKYGEIENPILEFRGL